VQLFVRRYAHVLMRMRRMRSSHARAQCHASSAMLTFANQVASTGPVVSACQHFHAFHRAGRSIPTGGLVLPSMLSSSPTPSGNGASASGAASGSSGTGDSSGSSGSSSASVWLSGGVDGVNTGHAAGWLVPQILLGDFNTYFDFTWPMDFLIGQTLAAAGAGVGAGADVGKPFNPCLDTLTRDYMAPLQSAKAPIPAWFRDTWTQLFPGAHSASTHMCMQQQQEIDGPLRSCLDAGHTFSLLPGERAEDPCRPDRILVRDALSTSRPASPTHGTCCGIGHVCVITKRANGLTVCS
jgi:hypothetical protein